MADHGMCTVALSCPTLCDPIDSLPGYSVHGISQARILEQVAISSFRDLPNLGIKPMSPEASTLAGGSFTTWEAQTILLG